MNMPADASAELAHDVDTDVENAALFWQGVAFLAIDQVVRSQINPRKHFDDGKLAELAESIKKHGVLQPIVVRPEMARHEIGEDGTHYASEPTGRFEIIAGERRWRASVLAGLPTIPALYRNLSNVEAIEVAVIENLQRADLHPLEEAEGYERLMKSHAYTVEEVADKIGKSRGYVYARMKLCALGDEARRQFYADEISASVALLVARLPKLRQDEALKMVKRWDGTPLSFRDAANAIQHRLMLSLKTAPFPIEDVELVADAGSCVTCSKRTGNEPELFSDIESADVCTDADCFGRKRGAIVERQAAQARAEGLQVVTGEEAKKLLPNLYAKVKGYVRATEPVPADERARSYEKALGKNAPKPVLVFIPGEPKPVKLYRNDAALKTAIAGEGLAGARKKSPEKLARERLRTIETATRVRIWEIVSETFANDLLKDLPLIATALFGGLSFEDRKKLAGAWQWPDELAESYGNKDQVELKFAEISTGRELALRILQMAVAPMLEVYTYGDMHQLQTPARLVGLAERYQVDLKRLRKVVAAKYLKPAEAEKTPAPAKAKAKGGTAGKPDKADAKAASAKRSQKASTTSGAAAAQAVEGPVAEAAQ